jgi:hypothetical protein
MVGALPECRQLNAQFRASVPKFADLLHAQCELRIEEHFRQSG